MDSGIEPKIHLAKTMKIDLKITLVDFNGFVIFARIYFNTHN